MDTKSKDKESLEYVLTELSDEIINTIRRTGFYLRGEFIGQSCHSFMGDRYRPDDYEYLAAVFTEGSSGYEEPASREVKEDFKNFITGKDSPYNPLIQELGDDLVITRSKEGYVTGMVLKSSGFRFNRKLLTNFFKTCRVMTEHNTKLSFWEEWKMKRGYPGGLVYLMMFHYDVLGNKTKTVHSPIEIREGSLRFNLEVFVNPNHKEWDKKFFNNPLSKNSGIHGEQNEAFGVPDGRLKFDPHKDIKSQGTLSVKTRFYNKYHDISNLRVLSNEQIERFFKGVASGMYDEFLPKP